VVLLAIEEDGGPSAEQLEHLAGELTWHGIDADVSIEGEASRPVAQQLLARAAELQADLLVVGAFGHGPLRERVFGGVTRALLEHADMPVFVLQ
jgi:nucleotide-binding universal stress UspA family protein